ncbi:MAG: FAD-dependent oxidoreductase, partial [Gammaproteobacteria bacterium]|nr:FAD-dependent oxidoreductase [Gammaproteobacteria bacterium]
IDRMTDWQGNLVVGGIGKELMDRCDAEGALIGPPPEQWGSRDSKLAGYWGVRTAGQSGIVNFSPTGAVSLLGGSAAGDRWQC